MQNHFLLKTFSILLFIILLPLSLQAQKALDLKGSHSVYVLSGLKINSNSNVTVNNTDVSVESNLIGLIGYQYWFDNEWAISFSTGIFKSSQDVKLINVNTISVIPVLMGFNYYPEKFALGDIGRIKFGINVGVYNASTTRTEVSFANIGASSINESVFGVEPNVGIDFFLGSWIKIGPNFSYHIISEFNEIIENGNRFSGAAFSVKVGFLF